MYILVFKIHRTLQISEVWVFYVFLESTEPKQLC